MTQPARPPAPDDEETFSAWPLVICIGVAKLATLTTILILSWGRESATMVLSTMAPWIGVVVALLIAPIGWQLRMRRMRRKREALLKAEFMNDHSEIALPGIEPIQT